MAQSNASPTDNQEVVGTTPAGSGKILSWRLIMKNNFYGHSHPSADSRRIVHKYWLSRGQSLSRKKCVLGKLTARHDFNNVDWAVNL